ncbi:hypothetical protein PtB15_9B426 [Puccinia triticina]|nr:hypothetical protein PtB15_9B426 [Puccinia triticina]
MEQITHWISACVVLHNFLLDDQSPDFYEADVDDVDSNDVPARQDRSAIGTQMRDRVFAKVIEYLDS